MHEVITLIGLERPKEGKQFVQQNKNGNNFKRAGEVPTAFLGPQCTMSSSVAQ